MVKHIWRMLVGDYSRQTWTLMILYDLAINAWIGNLTLIGMLIAHKFDVLWIHSCLDVTLSELLAVDAGLLTTEI